MPKFKLLKRGQKKVPNDIIVNKRSGLDLAPWKKHGKWENTKENDTTLGYDALSQALKDTGWDPKGEDPSLWG